MRPDSNNTVSSRLSRTGFACHGIVTIGVHERGSATDTAGIYSIQAPNGARTVCQILTKGDKLRPFRDHHKFVFVHVLIELETEIHPTWSGTLPTSIIGSKLQRCQLSYGILHVLTGFKGTPRSSGICRPPPVPVHSPPQPSHHRPAHPPCYLQQPRCRVTRVPPRRMSLVPCRHRCC